MIKQPAPSPRAGALSQLVIASGEHLSPRQALCDGGRSGPPRSGKQTPKEAGDLAEEKGPTSGRRSCAQARKRSTHQSRHERI